MLPLFLSLVILLCAGTDLYAKPPSDPQPELVEIIQLDVGQSFLPPIDVYTVPTGKRLVITDVIIRSEFGKNHSIFRDGTIVSRITVPFGRTGSGVYNHSYVLGI